MGDVYAKETYIPEKELEKEPCVPDKSSYEMLKGDVSAKKTYIPEIELVCVMERERECARIVCVSLI